MVPSPALPRDPLPVQSEGLGALRDCCRLRGGADDYSAASSNAGRRVRGEELRILALVRELLSPPSSIPALLGGDFAGGEESERSIRSYNLDTHHPDSDGGFLWPDRLPTLRFWI